MNCQNRKLGLSENMFNILHDFGSMIDVNAVRIEGPLTPDILEPALELVQKRHPMLQVHIVESADGPHFQSEGTLKIPLRVADKQYENQWIEMAEDELHQKFAGGIEPLCRVTFLRSPTGNGSCEIIATFHHSITDGLSCMHFIDDLLSYCQKIAAGESVSEPVTMTPLPPLEKLLESSLNSQNNVQETKEEPGPEIPAPQLIIEEEAPASQRRTRLATRILSKEMSLMLRNRCKQEKTTVHGALCAAMLFGAAKIASTDTPLHLACGSNVNLRKYCEPEVPDEYLGCLVSSIDQIHLLEKSSNFWDLARECKFKISQAIHSKIPHMLVSNIALFKKLDRHYLTQMSEYNLGRRNTTHVSNLGFFNFAEKLKPFKLQGVYFATGQHIIGTCLWLGAVSFSEQLFCTFAHVVPLVSVKTAQSFADSVMATLHQGCVSQSFTLNLLEERE